MANNSIIAWPDAERLVNATSFTGSSLNIGSTLTVNPVNMVFDNTSDVTVSIFIDGIQWKTFVAGECLVLDCRGNSGQSENFTFPLGSQFSTNASAGTTGFFSIAILYAR